MVVYVDVLLFINIILTYAVLITAEKLLKLSAKNHRLILSSIVGSLFSLLLFWADGSFLLSLLLKILSSFTVAFIAFGKCSAKQFIKRVFGFIIVSFLYSGGLILFYQLFRPPNMVIVNDVVYFEFNPLLMLGITALLYGVFLLFQKLFGERLKNTTVPLRFSVGGASYSCIGKIDTGCTLIEPFSGAPVILVDRSVINDEKLCKKRIIPYSTVGNSSILYASRSDEVSIDGNTVDKIVYIACADIPDKICQAIINSEIIR